jgi:hypothetical protein
MTAARGGAKSRGLGGGSHRGAPLMNNTTLAIFD